MTGPLGDRLGEALDPCLMAARIGMNPDPWQARALRSTSRRILAVTSRQVGKSSVAQVKAVHRAIYQPGSLVLIFAPTARQAQRLFHGCARIYRELGQPLALEADNLSAMELENGSQIIALPGNPDGVRGYPACDLMIIDEAAWVADDLYHVVRPMLSVSDGQLMVLSTPNGKRGWLYELATSDDARWERFTVKATDCPRITAEFLAEERESKGARIFAQEYECAFIDGAGGLFDPDDLAAMFSAEFEPLDLDEPRHVAPLRVVS